MYTIYDSRPNHNARPFLFTLSNGRYAKRVFNTYEEAAHLADKMNAQTSLTTFVVKPYQPTSFELVLLKYSSDGLIP